MPSAKDTKSFSEFVDWCRFHDLRMPVDGDDVGTYLLELMVDGASLHDVERATTSIWSAYQRRQHFLDLRPVQAALEMCAAQLSKNRVLN